MTLRPGCIVPLRRTSSRHDAGKRRCELAVVFLLGVAAGLILSLWWRAAQLRQAQLRQAQLEMEEIETGIRPEK